MNQLRQEKMRAYIEQRNVVTIKELQVMFPKVSLMTIHRDLDALMEAGAVVKFRGGARSVRHSGDPEFNVRIGENNAGKLTIAQKAMELLQPHSSVFLCNRHPPQQNSVFQYYPENRTLHQRS